jgi:probable F420-dependent oxidoreductase
MKINVPLPFDRIDPEEKFDDLDAIRAVGKAVEKAGFHAGLVTDHPVPTGRWLDAGGHHAQAPFVVLALLAAVTTKLRLQTGILVLPYRNPFITARDIATLDHFSGGRVALSVGAGYLKGEYKALGVDFEHRNELMDEYMRALRVSLTGAEFTFDGTGYKALGNRILPAPVQKRLPLYVGGNSRRAIRRVVELGDGWNPFFTTPGLDTTSRTVPFTGEDDLRAGIAYMKEHCEKIGRADLPEVILGGVNKPGETISLAQIVDRIGQFRALGVTAAGVSVQGRNLSEWCENAERVGEEVIAKIAA